MPFDDMSPLSQLKEDVQDYILWAQHTLDDGDMYGITYHVHEVSVALNNLTDKINELHARQNPSNA